MATRSDAGGSAPASRAVRRGRRRLGAAATNRCPPACRRETRCQRV
jgi:hypothetical protein